MGRFDKIIPYGMGYAFSNGKALLKCLLLLGISTFMVMPVHAEEKGKIAVLPFRVHALHPMGHLSTGLQEMFTTRMAEKGLRVIPPDVVNKHYQAFHAPLSGQDMVALGRNLGVDTIITGSITEVGRGISLDVKAINVPGKRPPYSLFFVEDDVDKLPEAVDRATTSLYNQVAGVVQIDSIRVTGNKRIETEAILAVVKSKKGEALDHSRIDQDLRAIFKMGFFKDVVVETKPGPHGDIVIFRVTEKPSIARITFKGNKEEGAKELKKEIGIKPYTILNLSEVRQSINQLKDFYRKQGYYNVQIKDEVKPLPQNEVALTYDIKEGSKVYITNIKFVGNSHFSDHTLRKVMMTKEKGLFSIITKSGVLDRKKLEFDLHRVAAFYYNRGYIKARVGEPNIVYKKGKGLTITIEITEGPQFQTNRVGVKGDLIVPPEELLRKVQVTKEKAFNSETVRKDALALQEFYASKGYAYATVTPITKEYPKRHLVDVTYMITKNLKVRIERINITGNTITRDKVIRRELKLVEGDYFSGQKLAKSLENLNRLNFFSDVQIHRKKGSSNNLMILDVSVKEKPTGSFGFGAGFDSYDGALGMFSVSQNNLFGLGDKLSATGEIGTKTQSYIISFTDPWFLDKPISAGVDLYKYVRLWPDYTQNSLGLGLRSKFPFPIHIDSYTKGTVGYSYDKTDIYDIVAGAAPEIQEMAGWNTTSAVSLGIIRDSTNNPWNTTRGSINSFTYQYAGRILGGDIGYDSFILGSEWYFSMPWHTVFVVKGHWGLMEPRGFLPSFKKFRLGGINTVRGFDYGTISPYDPSTGDYLGGTKMMYYNLEYRFPLFKEQGVDGIFFFDAGNVFSQSQSWTFNHIRRSVGLGIRWFSPIGPVIVEWGYNLAPYPWERHAVADFTMGGTF